MSLENKVVVITGGGRGIGQTAALRCAEQGAEVVIAARSQKELNETAAEIEEKTGRKVLAIVCDVSSTEQVKSLFERAEREAGPVYGLICAAAVYGPMGLLEDQSLEEWETALNINVMGTVRCLHTALKYMKPRRQGRIVLFSGGGEGKFPRFSSYVSSKGAIWRLTETIAAEAFPENIYINAIAPGAVNTKLMDDVLAAGPGTVGKDFYEKTLKQKDSGGTSSDKAANLILYLLSEKSKGLSGKILSALWDSYETFENVEKITSSDLYNFRRVTTLPTA